MPTDARTIPGFDQLPPALQEELTRRLAAAEYRPPPGSAMDAYTGAAAEGLVDNVLGVPNTILGSFGRDLQLVGKALNPMLSAEERMTPTPFPDVMNLPSGREALSRAQSLLGGTMQDAMAQREATAQEHPLATLGGDLTADALTLAGGRAPIKSVQGRAGGLLDKWIQDVLEHAARVMTAPKEVGVKAMVADVLKNESFQHLMRGTGRSLETGLEGAVLSTLKDNNPLETAAFSAGGQLVGSAGLSLVLEGAERPYKFVGRKPRGVVDKAYGLALMSGMLGGVLFLGQQFSPGDNSQFLADEKAFTKTAGMVMLGALAAATGAKRSQVDGLLKRYPALADSVSSLGRGAAISAIDDMTADNSVAKVMSNLSVAPEAFKKVWIDKLDTGLRGGKLKTTVNELIQSDEEFAALVDSPDPRLAKAKVINPRDVRYSR